MANLIKILKTVGCLVVGLLFLVVGLLFFFNYDPDAYDTEVTGTIVDIDEHYELVGDDNELQYTVYVDYTVGDKTFSHAEYPGYNSSMKVGDTLNFFCMSKDPAQIAGSDKNAAPYIGLGFAVAGLIIVVITVLRMIRKK